MIQTHHASVDELYQLLSAVKDPEIPVISIQELGILQEVFIENGVVIVNIIPTYSGCPAMHTIKADIKAILQQHQTEQFQINLLNEPVWTTDMISASGRAAMLKYGIAPPLNPEEKHIICPQCGSGDTICISQFGSTACKALYRCEACLEPFDYFKCHA